MADNENVTIRINVKADTAAIDRVQKRLAALCAQADRCNDTFSKLGKTFDDDTKSKTRNTKETDKLKRKLQDLGKIGEGVSKVMRKGLMLALKGTLLETAAYAAALSSVNLLLKSGNLLSRAWQASLKGIGVAAANAAAGIAALGATFAMAMRQFAAAQSSAGYGGSFKGASVALRTIQSDAQLAMFGIKSLNQAFAAASKNAPVTGATVKALRGLADFAVASGDMEKGLAAAANMVSLLQSGKGAGSEGVLKAASELGPQFEKAFKEVVKSGKATNDQLLAMFSSGALAQQAGIAGTAGNVRGSLLGQLKSFGTEAQVVFADLGATFIGPVQQAFEQIRRIFYRTITQISGNLSAFGRGSFVETLVKVVDKLALMTETLFNKYLPQTETVVNNFVNKWNSFTGAIERGFDKFSAFLNKFSGASKEINKFFGGIIRAVGGELQQGFGNFATLITENSSDFQKFGDQLQRLIREIFNLFRQIRKAFFEALPAITAIVSAISSLVGALAGLVDLLSSSGLGGYGSLLGAGLGTAGLMGMSGKGRGKLKGAGAFIGRNKGATAAIAGSLLASQVPGIGGFLGPMVMGGYLGRGIGKALPNSAGLGKVFDFGAKLQSRGGMLGKLGGGLSKGSLALTSVTPGAMMAGGAVAAGGAIATNAAMDWTENKFGNTGATMGAGALGGALTGAAVGSIIPVIGTGVGALIGGAIGAFSGWMKSGAAKKKARKAGENFANGYADNIKLAIQHGAIDQAKTMITRWDTELQRATDGMNRGGEARKKANQVMEEQLKTINPAVHQFNRNLNDLEKMTGKTREEIIAAAQAAEVDLSSNLMDLQTIMTETGLIVGQFGIDFNTAIATALGTAVDSMQGAFDILEAPKILDEAAIALQQKIGAPGGLEDTDRLEFMRTVATQAATLFPDDQLKAMQYIRENIGTATAPGRQFTAPGGRLYGTQAEFFGEGGADMLAAFYGSQEADLRRIISQNIVSEVAASGGSLDYNQLQTVLAGKGFDELSLLAGQVRTAGFLTGTTGGTGTARGGEMYMSRGGLGADASGFAQSELSALLGTQIEVTRSENEEFLSQFGSESEKMIAGFGMALDPLESGMSTFNENINLLIEAVKGGDTSTPRRNFVNTLSKHDAFDSMIAGKRVMTSGMRNNRLGSLSSDHRFGLAYDLTGQNLGMYQAAVRKAGGYAEFHGMGDSRHLHVVPGGGPAVGDTSTPYMGGTGSTGSVINSNDSYNITVNASPGMDVKALADEVMNRINRIQRNSAERTS